MTSQRSRLGLTLGLAFAVLFLLGLLPRLTRARSLRAEADSATAAPTVRLTGVQAAGPGGPLSLPGTVEALHETAIYARSSGYVARWYPDIGARVRSGQVMAEIETPDLDQELDQARAALAQSRTTLDLSKSTLDRWQTLIKDSAVAEQDLDERQTAYHNSQAASDAALANFRRLQALKGFSKVIAPFSGVVTARRVDVGQLVAADGGAENSLFSLAETDTMRVYVDVPQSYIAGVSRGDSAAVLVRDIAPRPFTGRVARTAQSLDPASRTMRVEIQIPNKNGVLLPGLYAQVSLNVRAAAAGETVRIPANTIAAPTSGPEVVVVGADGIAHRRKIDIARDYGSAVDVASGVSPGDRLVINPTDDITDGARVGIAR